MHFMKTFMMIFVELFIVISAVKTLIISMGCVVMIFKCPHFLQGKLRVSSSNSNTISPSLCIISISLSRNNRSISSSSVKFCKYSEIWTEKYDTYNYGGVSEKRDLYFVGGNVKCTWLWIMFSISLSIWLVKYSSNSYLSPCGCGLFTSYKRKQLIDIYGLSHEKMKLINNYE